MSGIGGWVLYILCEQVEDKRIWNACILCVIYLLPASEARTNQFFIVHTIYQLHSCCMWVAWGVYPLCPHAWGPSRLHFLCALPNFIWWKYVWFDLKKKQKELTPHCQPWGWEMVYEVKVLVTQAWWPEFEPHDTPKKLGAVVYICNPSTSTGRWEAEPGELAWRASLQIIQPDNARCQLKPHLCHEMRLKERMESWKAVIWSLYACHMIFMCSDTCVPPYIPN